MKARWCAEIPPTAGLPPHWRDLFAAGGDLAGQLQTLLHLPQPQVECSGAAALMVALTTLRRMCARDEPQRNTVIIPAYTCPLVPMAVAHCGLRVRLCDIRPGHFDMDLEQLARMLDAHVLAVLPTHLGGRVADTAAMAPMVRNSGAALVEDAAQALGADVGQHGDATFYSLAAGKGLSMYEGGVLVAPTPRLRQALQETSRQMVPVQRWMELRRCMEFVAYTALYRPAGLRLAWGWPRRRALAAGNALRAAGDDFGAHIPLHRVSHWRQGAGAGAARRLTDFLRRTREQALPRVQRLRAIDGIEVMADATARQGTWPFLMVLLPDAATCAAALERLWHTPLGVGRLFIHALPDYAYLRRIAAPTEVPAARDFAARMLTISNSLWLEEDDFTRICRVLQDVVAGRQRMTAPFFGP